MYLLEFQRDILAQNIPSDYDREFYLKQVSSPWGTLYQANVKGSNGVQLSELGRRQKMQEGLGRGRLKRENLQEK